MKWRKLAIVVHRDLGYVCVGLTVVYAISGVAVNHRADWNPNFSITQETVQLGSTGIGQPASPDFVENVLTELGLEGPVRGTFRPDPESVDIFLEGSTISIDLTNGEATYEQVRERPLLRVANALHLNEPKRLWTWMADLYAVSLLLLAITGLFVIKGKNGITGRGAWLTGAGVAIPVLFLLLYL